MHVSPPADAYETGLHRPRYTLALLTVLSAFSFMDRQILAVLTQPVKLEFGLTDLQIGLITGLGFALTFGLLGVPLGRWADQHERRRLIMVCRGAGGALAALGATASGFWMLLLSRSGGAVSDAGGNPASLSMVADLYPPEQRARAMSVFASGGSLGALMALVGGSWVAQAYGWRVALASVGCVSLLLTCLFWLTVQEPRRSASGNPLDARQSSLGAVREIWSAPVTRWLIVAAACVLLAGYSFGSWNTALLVRHHGLSLRAAGWISGAAALSSMVGGLVSGALADVLTRRDPRWQIGVPMLGVAAALPTGLAYLMLPAGSVQAATLLVVLYAFFLTWWVAPTYAALSLVVAPERRATASAMLLLAGSIIGNGLGAILTGWLSDRLAPVAGTASLAWALSLMLAMLLPALLAFARARRAYLPALDANRMPTPPPTPETTPCTGK
ncbi:MFS transporter [Rhodoferax lacus]|uniref:MFS transporter n=1 Tax=Rhodoferax lacus TaxID=2184758 RepID=A0A3E1R8E6_9BURK|nr:MFS transporter [Rhodoferax lacus]RFO94980.1 MFS transporter [Rhodoferax lacus]